MKLTKEQIFIVELSLLDRISKLKEAASKNDDPEILDSIDETKNTLAEVQEYYR